MANKPIVHPPGFLTLWAAARLRGVHHATLKRAIQLGELRAFCRQCYAGVIPAQRHRCPRWGQVPWARLWFCVRAADVAAWSGPIPWQQRTRAARRP